MGKQKNNPIPSTQSPISTCGIPSFIVHIYYQSEVGRPKYLRASNLDQASVLRHKV